KEDVCALITRAVFPNVVGRLYADKYFTEQDDSFSEEMVKQILTVFKDTILGHDWLDDETKKAAVDKAAAISMNVGFSQWIKDDKELAEEYPYPVSFFATSLI